MWLLDDHFFMQQAFREAEKAFEADEVPVGAVVVMNNKIIARAHNQVEQLNDSTAHAEILALTAAYHHLGSKYLPDATLYVTLEPCLMCTGALYWSKLGAIVWGASDAKNGHRSLTGNYLSQEGKFPFHPKTQIRTGILQDECAAIMQQFFRQKRK